MSDLESRLAETLRDGANGAPGAVGLADAARTRARHRRRARLGGVAAVVALAIAVPAGVAAWPHSSGDAGDRDVADTAPDAPPTEDGYRWESWHGVTVQVPDTWDHGSLGDWCAAGGEIGTPRVERPGTVANMILCAPASTYGLTFQEIGDREDFEWPVVSQTGDGWPDPNFVGGRGIAGVLVTVATPDAELAQRVLDSMRAIGGAGDPNGCPVRLAPGESTPPEGGLSVCRYDESGALDQSEVLFGQDAGDAVTALQAAPDPGECADTSQGSQPHQVIVLEAAGTAARVDLAAGCPRVQVDGDVRQLTSDVLYWALSPGWSGSVDGDVPLPGALRQR